MSYEIVKQADDAKMSGRKYELSDAEKKRDDSFQSQNFSSRKDEEGSVHEKGEPDTSSIKDDKKKKEEQLNMVGMGEVFRFSNKLDKVLMFFGTLGALLLGATMPAMIVIFGEMSDTFVDDAIYKSIVSDLYPNISVYYNVSYDELIEDSDLFTSILKDLNMTAAVELVDDLGGNILDEMSNYAVYYAIIGGGVMIVGYMGMAFWQLAAYRQTQRIRVALFNRILHQEISWFDTQEVGELNTRLSDDVNKIQEGIGEKMCLFFQWFATFLAGFIVGFVYGWELTLVILSVSPLLALSGAIMGKLGAAMTSNELKAYAKAGAVAEEVLGGIRTVVAFGGQEKECKRYSANLSEAKDYGIKKGKVNGLAMGVVFCIMFASYALAFWYGSELVRTDDNYSAGTVLVVFFCVLMGAFAIGNAMPNLQNLATARGAAYGIFRIIDMEPSIDSSSPDGVKPDSLRGNIEFRDVRFNYPSRPDTTVLDGLNLKVNVGQTVALVGSSGCGKSTTVQLIQRFYDPLQGQVLIDDVDIKEYNIKWLRGNIGVVSQEPVLFATTIAENIRYGRDGVTQKEIVQAAMEANAHNFIMELPKQYDTLVGERGAQLSGGQKQRIAIARALVRDPKIILLDEATSALDTESESIVQAALDKAGQGRTTIVIAHRLSTVRNADIICGLQNGQVVEMGSHDELMKLQGIYYQLVTNQTSPEDDELLGELSKTELARAFSVHSAHERQLSIDSPKHLRQRTVSTSSGVAKEEEEEMPDPDMMRVMKMNSPEWHYIVLGCFCAIVSGVIQPAFAVVFAEILTVYSETDLEKQKEQTDLYSLLFLVIGVVAGIAMTGQSTFLSYSGEALTMRLRQKAFRVVLGQEIAYFDDHKHSVGALTTRLATEASAVQGATGSRLAMMISSLASISAGLIIGFVFSWELTLLILAFTPLFLFGGFVQMRVMMGSKKETKDALEQAGKVAVESIENIRTVANLVKENKFHADYAELTDRPYKKSLSSAHIQGVGFAFSQALFFFAYAALFTFGAWLIDEGRLEYGDMFKVFGAIVFSAMSVGQASSFAPDYGKAKHAAACMFELFDREVSIDSYSEEGDKPSSFSGRVQLEGVMFNYPTRPGVPVLRGVNFEVKPGQMVALVGSSGCGKSTIVQLMERFYDPLNGQVMVDNRDIRGLHLQWFRRQIGLVQQEPILFDYSIRENIAYGDTTRDIPMSEIIEAAKQANIHNFISTLPQGYETMVGDKGAQLSGGQKQRVAIARALIRSPKIMLLDEATSALDTESEKVVQEALDKAQEGRTSIVIAHRLSTIQNADCIIVLRRGQVTEMGTHSELLTRRGFYFKLHQVQARKR